MKEVHLEFLYGEQEQHKCSRQDQKMAQMVLPTHILSKLIEKQENTLLTKEELTRGQFKALIVLFFHYKQSKSLSMSPTQLYESMVFSSGGMTKVLKQLEQEGYISRTSSSEDKRSQLVSLEPKGLQKISRIKEKLTEQASEFFEPLNESEKDNLRDIYKKLLSHHYGDIQKNGCGE